MSIRQTLQASTLGQTWSTRLTACRCGGVSGAELVPWQAACGRPKTGSHEPAAEVALLCKLTMYALVLQAGVSYRFRLAAINDVRAGASAEKLHASFESHSHASMQP